MNTLREEKHAVPSEFDAVAGSYDLLTGMNPGYRKHLRMSAERLRVPHGGRVLDLCCGTGLSTEALVQTYPSARVVGLDGSRGMLERARSKPSLAKVELVLGDATSPAVEGPFDGILMAYGIRNVPDPDACLSALVELLSPGGHICFHEYSVADSRASRLVWNAVSYAVIIPSGAITARGSGIYRYLRRSVLDFDGVKAFEARMRRAGLVDVHTEPMDGWQRGIVHSFLGRRP